MSDIDKCMETLDKCVAHIKEITSKLKELQSIAVSSAVASLEDSLEEVHRVIDKEDKDV